MLSSRQSGIFLNVLVYHRTSDPPLLLVPKGHGKHLKFKNAQPQLYMRNEPECQSPEATNLQNVPHKPSLSLGPQTKTVHITIWF